MVNNILYFYCLQCTDTVVHQGGLTVYKNTLHLSREISLNTCVGPPANLGVSDKCLHNKVPCNMVNVMPVTGVISIVTGILM